MDARGRVRAEALDRAVTVATTVADIPEIRAAVVGPEPSGVVQPLAEQIRVDTGVDFVVVMGLDRTRYSHPDPALIGRTFIGDVGQAPAGEVFTQDYTGTLGPSVRVVVPIRDADGAVVALVAVGVVLDRVDAAFWRTVVPIGIVGAAALALALGSAWLIARRVRRQTYGLDGREVGPHVRVPQRRAPRGPRGLLVDAERRVELVNAEARRLLRLDADAVGRPPAGLGLPDDLCGRRAGTLRARTPSWRWAAGRWSSTPPRRGQGRRVGAVVTLRDRTELQAVTGELDAVRRLSEALRSQNHESANRLHTVIQLVEMGRTDEALDFAHEELQIAELLADQMVASTGSPALTALLVGKASEAAVRGASLEVTGDAADARCAISTRDLVTVVGNLVDNALDAVAGREGARVGVHVDWDAARFRVDVDDDGPGVAASDRDRVLERGWSTKSGTAGTRGIGLSLVAQIAERCGGGVEVGSSPWGGARLTVELREVRWASACWWWRTTGAPSRCTPSSWAGCRGSRWPARRARSRRRCGPSGATRRWT